MINFAVKLNIAEIVIPLLSTGIALIGLILFGYIYFRWRHNLYISMIYMVCSALIFIASESVIIIAGGLKHNLRLAMEFHRIEQLGGALFIFGLPFFLSYQLELTLRWKKITRIVAYINLCLVCIIIAIAFIRPDLFISQTTLNHLGTTIEGWYGRGQEGVVYQLRDILLGMTILYGCVLVVFDLLKHNQLKYLLPVLLGLLLAILGAIDDSIHVHRGMYLGLYPFPKIIYSRFTTGITLFILLTMISLIRRFISQAKNVEEAYSALHLQEERLQEIAANINEVVWLIDYPKPKLLYINGPAYEKIWEQQSEKLYGSFHSWIDSIHPEDRDNVINETIHIRRKNKYELRYRILLPDKRVKWIRERVLPIKDDNNEIYRIIKVSEDVTISKYIEQELLHIAYHDQLTGLLNRQSFYDKFIITLIKAKEHALKRSKAFLFMDLDYFKSINNALDHRTGDEILKQVAQRIQKVIGKQDSIFRIGGDEFIIILHDIADDKAVTLVAEQLIRSISEPFIVKNHTFHIGMSIGITIYPKDGEDAETLMKNLDTSLIEAKKEKNTFQFFTQSLKDKALEKIRIIDDLREAIKRREFILYYQPLVSISGQIIGAEALIRWNHPERGLVYPTAFICFAEETGLIIPIGYWVIEEACKEIKQWIDIGRQDLYLSVNLSLKQFKDKDLVANISEVMKKTHIREELLHLEITESVLMTDPEDTIKKLKTLCDKGIKFSVDDFGTGYSSLSSLKNFPIQSVKIDRSFVAGIPQCKEDMALVKGIISIAHEMNLQTIAEGVETQEQLQYLKEIGCNFIQGYYYSEALSSEQFSKFIKNYGKV